MASVSVGNSHKELVSQAVISSHSWRARSLAAACRRAGVSPAAAAVQFPLRHAAVAAVVLGMRSAAEVQADIAAFSAPVPPTLWAELDAVVDADPSS
jgi:aryl-alcohol dehydrogenase-like predicted oxidoreductase